MPTPVQIKDTKTGNEALVSNQRALAVSPPAYSFSYNATLDVDNTPVEIVKPKAGQVFCITALILAGNKNISTSVDAVVDIFEADPEDTTTSIRDIVQLPVPRSDSIILTNLFLCTGEAVHIMGKTSDDDVLVTILGYYTNG